jgi:hypothetical protein
LTNTAGPAAALSATSGTPQSAGISTAFGSPLVAQIVDAEGNPVSDAGVTITFTPPATGASVTFAGGVNTAMTNASGAATSTAVTANGTTGGPFNVTASAPGLTSVNFSLTNTDVPASISVTSGSGQSATVSTAFAAPLVATVLDAGSNPVSGVIVTFAPPASGASATLAGGVNTATTNASGVATSAVVSANATAGGPYTVAATVVGVATAANFTLTNTAAVGTTQNFSYYLSGTENSEDLDNYSVAGSVTINTTTGAVTGGEQDYNDADFVTAFDPITGGQLTTDPTTGQGTLTITTADTSVGVEGTETLGVQFVNAKHALIIQFDQSATSSGSMDLQTLPTTLSGPFAFAIGGNAFNPDDDSLFSFAAGGIFTVSGTALTNGFFDLNLQGSVSFANAFPAGATISAPDAFGRGTITQTNLAETLAYYIVGPEAMRVIDIDLDDTAVGSAFGQGTSANTFTNATFPTSVFTVASNSDAFVFYAAVGTLVPAPEAPAVRPQGSTGPVMNNFTGVADVNELLTFLAEGAQTSGTYFIDLDGYGGFTYTSASTGDLSTLGLYAVDNAININDPNNTSTGLGGAFVVDLDENLVGIGVMVPQTDVATTSFAGNYAFGAQMLNDNGANEFNFAEVDFVGLGLAGSGGAFNGTGPLNDPFESLSSTLQVPAAGFSWTATADSSNPGSGRYVGAPLDVTIGASEPDEFTVAAYQANGGLLFWIEDDIDFGSFTGPITQSTFTAPTPAVKAKGQVRAKVKP